VTPEPLTHALYSGLSRVPRLADGEGAHGLRVLTYHSVGARLPEDPYGTSIETALFEAHMTRLASREGGFRTAALSEPHGQDGWGVALTFDDGYKDTWTTAWPILETHGLAMTVFVATANLESGSGLYLTPAELKALAKRPGVTIGSHGHAHQALDRLSDRALKEDLSKSRQILEELTGKAVSCLSYPFGRADRRVRDAAQEAGYRLGACSRYGLNAPGRDPLLLCRTEIVAWDTLDDLALKVAGHWDWFRFRHPDPAAK
jgi:peptidoglycan/xylan/chitin deacetylase (PgdA/CDA1 family)